MRVIGALVCGWLVACGTTSESPREDGSVPPQEAGSGGRRALEAGAGGKVATGADATPAERDAGPGARSDTDAAMTVMEAGPDAPGDAEAAGTGGAPATGGAVSTGGVAATGGAPSCAWNDPACGCGTSQTNQGCPNPTGPNEIRGCRAGACVAVCVDGMYPDAVFGCRTPDPGYCNRPGQGEFRLCWGTCDQCPLCQHTKCSTLGQCVCDD